MERMTRIITDAIKAGGATWDHEMQPIQHKSGYMISLPRYETRHDKRNIRGIADTVNRLRETIKEGLQAGITYVGLWIDGDTAYVDISIREIRRDVAMNFGRSYGQRAIYDLATGQSIYLKKEEES